MNLMDTEQEVVMKRQDRQSKKYWVYGTVVACLCTASLLVQTARAEVVIITRVSVDSQGNVANDTSERPALNADGSLVAFTSEASNLVSNDTNEGSDVFVHDRHTGHTTRVSVDSQGAQANNSSVGAALSADGRLVVFDSLASNLVSNDTNEGSDVFVHDRSTGRTTRVSVDSQGTEADSNSSLPVLSADGSLVAFISEASNLVPNDTNDTADIFVHDRSTGRTTRVSVDSQGTEADSNSSLPVLSADGSLVAFISEASNLVPNDTNDTADIFVHDRRTGRTTRISVEIEGGEGNVFRDRLSLSGDGRLVAFATYPALFYGEKTYEETHSDVFLHDRSTGRTTRIAIDSEGHSFGYAASEPAISADGRVVAFAVYEGGEETQQVYLHDRSTGHTTLVSESNRGQDGGDHSEAPALSADGHIVAFMSYAPNLVPGDIDNGRDVFVHSRIFSLTALHSGKCLDVQKSSLANGAPVQQWTCHGKDNQRWILKPLAHHSGGEPNYRLQALHSGKCLDVRQASLANGAPVQQWTCHSPEHQTWILEPDLTLEDKPSYSLRALHSGKCLDVRQASLANGAPVQQWTCHGPDHQRWLLEDALSF